MYLVFRTNSDPAGGGSHYVGVAYRADTELLARAWIVQNKKSSWDTFEVLKKIG